MGRKILLILVGIAMAVPVLASTAVAQEADSGATATVVVLVDLSGSLTAADVAEEIRAVGVMNSVPGIDLYVIGFASEGSLPATEVVCEPGDDLAECALALARRSNSEGNDTDHAAALAAAAEVLGPAGPGGSPPRIVLLLTDGEFDPSGSGNPTTEELAGLDLALVELEQSNTSVWPLGFGGATKAELNALAISAPGSCRAARGLLVEASQEVPAAVNKIIGLASCSKTVRDDQLVVLPDTELVVVTYAVDELSDGTVGVRTGSRNRDRFDCTLDDVADVWTCEIPTANLGTGEWFLTPEPRQFATPYQQAGSTAGVTTTTAAPTTTASADSSTTTRSVSPTTTAPVTTTIAGEAAAPGDDGGGFPWAIVAAGIVGLAIGSGVVLWSRRT